MRKPADGMGAQDPEALRRENERLRRAVRELELLNEVATATGAARDLEEVLRLIVRRAIEAMGAEQGVLSLIDAEKAEKEARTAIRTSAFTSERGAFHVDGVFHINEVLLGWMLIYRRPIRSENPAEDPRLAGGRWDPAIRSMLAVPLLAHGALIGILGVFNKRGEAGFSAEDERLLAILAQQSAQVVEAARQAGERERALRLFGQHTAPEVVDALVRSGPDLASDRRRVCVMFFDLRDFTARAEAWPPEQVVDYLNAVFDFAIELVNRHRGIVHQLLGDGFMALFGAPVETEADCRNAVRAALAIAEHVAEAGRGGSIEPTEVGIGLHAGEVVAGVVGSSIHKEYKVTGDVVNVAARVQGLCRELGAQVLASEAVWRQLNGEVAGQPLGPVALRGRREPVVLYRLA